MAVKILPRVFSDHPDRLARFEREARTLAALNHPHIGAIYGFEEDGDLRGLVLELVDGDTLAEHLARRPLPASEVIAIASQIADALDAAHAKGIVHRDLKPANIKITQSGVVKVLDFGLAKAIDDTDESAPPTMATREGTVMGTAPYMSPEQARGLAVDKRTDIWAFGCVLYEMLSGRQAFQGNSRVDILAAVVNSDPDLGALPGTTPPTLRSVVARCLQKDVQRRARDIGDIRHELDAPAALPERPHRLVPHGIIGAMLAGVAGLVLLLGAVFAWRASIPPQTSSPGGLGSVARVSPITTYPGEETSPSFSPDGNQIAFSWDGETRGQRDIYVAQIGGQTPLRLTTDPLDDIHPAWSPDGRQIAFVRRRDPSNSDIIVIQALGGPERKLTAIRL